MLLSIIFYRIVHTIYSMSYFRRLVATYIIIEMAGNIFNISRNLPKKFEMYSKIYFMKMAITSVRQKQNAFAKFCDFRK